ncbi:hypothetical protein VaNZ11_004589 [Volvox africanus]|uniref:Uncharacterized protein n=1 Tax=Volvox africanus TaxID=51714 RepID=A0ABQ5RXV7_9CHLO|nr:hypothetical protein VaNZ11_004589 [Volvox africanus]
MSGHPQQPEPPKQIASVNIYRQDGGVAEVDQQQDVWAELYGIVHGFAETVQVALQAFTPSDEKAVSAITKKRLALRSIQGLKQSQDGIGALLEHLKALQAASQTWQRSMTYASKSHQELMEQVESTTQELHKTSDRLRGVEAQRLAAVREAELLRARTEQQEDVINEARTSLKQREEDLETLQFSVHELQASSSAALQDLDRLRQAAAEAEGRAQAATAALDEAKGEATKAHSLAERHQQVVAKLTADNLVFLMQLKKAEADLAAANQDRAKLRLAAEQQRGPWFDQVRAGVEERVRQALQHSQELEARFERREAEHTAHQEALREQLTKLEEELHAAQNHAQVLQQRLESTNDSKDRAENRCTAAEITAREVQKGLENLAAENRVLQESIRSMRQECTERWVKEQAAIGQVDGLEQRIEELHQTLSQQTAQLAALQRQLDTQTGINRQLMARKEEVEWQLMAAMAKIDGGTVDQPAPLNLRVSGLLQVGGPNNEHQCNSTGAQNPRSTGLGGLAKTTDAPAEAAECHSAFHAASAGGAAEALRPASVLKDCSKGPYKNLSASCDVPVYSTSQGAGDGDSRSSPFTSKPSRALYGQPQHAGPSVVVNGGPGSKGSSPPLAHNLHEKGSIWRESLRTPEATLLIAHDDLATFTQRAARKDLHAVVTSHPGMLANLYRQQQSQPRQHGLREDTVTSGQSNSGAVLNAPARWASLEAASTVVSSPPSSVALSTASGSPEKAPSLLPSEPSSREPGAPAVTIRTVSNGRRQQPSDVRHVASASAAGGDVGLGHEQIVPNAQGVITVSGEDAVSYTHDGLGRLERRGSLHDGEDVWLANVVSTSSSNDSEFFFSAGVVIQHAAPTDVSHNVHAGAQQSQLHQLQQRLQVQLQGTSAVTVTGSPGRHRPFQDAEPRGSLQAQACARAIPSAAYVLNDEEDIIRARAAPQRNDTGRVVITSGTTMRSVTSTPASAGHDIAPAREALAGAQDGSDRTDLGIGVLNIVKCDAHQESVSRSPMHPALSGKAIQGAPCSPKPASSSSPTEPTLTEASQRMSSEHAPAVCSVDAARPFLRELASMHAGTARIPVCVQAGPPFYATSGPLERNDVAVMEHWMHSTGSRTYTAPVLPLNLKTQELTVLASPARSTTSMRSPRSPVHPAIILVADRGSGESAEGRGSARKTATGPDENSGGLSSRMGAGVQAVQPDIVAGVSTLGTATISDLASGLLQVVASVSSFSESAVAGLAEEGLGATARPRVSFHGLTHDSQAAPGGRSDGSTSAIVGQAMGSSMSSSTGSLVHMSGGSGTQQPQHKPNSVKSVRFSDHESDDQVAQPSRRQRESQESQGIGASAQTPGCSQPHSWAKMSRDPRERSRIRFEPI